MVENNETKEKSTNSKKKKLSKGQKASRMIIISISILVVVVIAVIGIAYYVLNHYIHKTTYIDDSTVSSYALENGSSLAEKDINDAIESMTDDEGNTLSVEEASSLAEELASIASSQAAELAKDPIAPLDGVYNLLLIGIDTRAGKYWAGNSDSMILVTINNKNKMIYCTSFMRDTFVNLEGYGASKLNRAHAIGEGPLLVKTIEQNFHIHIDNYARVNFYDMAEIIDAIGGVDLTLNDAEVAKANFYIDEITRGFGAGTKLEPITQSGTIHCNGIQAVAYARIRSVGNADFQRTERQRIVLIQMFEKLKNSDPTTVNNFLNTALPKVYHNIPEDKIMELIGNANIYLTYGLRADLRVPADGTYTSMSEMLVTDFAATNKWLTSIIYENAF